MVLGETQEIVAVDKPPCMPVHVAGQHRKNTVAGVLQATRPDLGPLLPVHRLDKPVSGVLLFARSSEAATKLCNLIQSHQVEKVYVALVSGAFPEQPFTVDVPLSFDSAAGKAHAHPQSEPESSDSSKVRCATTSFRRLWKASHGLTSLVECRPRTGRSHQIRMHLAHVGYPIANDWLYGGRLGGDASSLATGRARNPDSGCPLPRSPVLHPGTDLCSPTVRGSPTISDTPAAPIFNPADLLPSASLSAPRGALARSAIRGCGVEQPVPGDQSELSLFSSTSALPTRMHSMTGQPGRGPHGVTLVRVDESHFDALCRHCPSMIPVGWPTDLNALWLHAQSYSGPDFAFSSPLPAWATACKPGDCGHGEPATVLE